MKNIHILPTDKPSRLHFNEFEELLFTPKYGKLNGVNIYITSDEEINQQTKPCWCINTIKNTWDADLSYYQGSMPQYHYKGFKKIILTTDIRLAPDVQKIDDDFLEWFVKNPSCEEVDIKSWIKTYEDGYSFLKMEFEIIIPKEKPKQYSKVLSENGIELFFDEQAYLIKEKPDYTALLQPVGSRQETLEEAAEKYVKDSSHHLYQLRKQCFLDGAKWQQEQIGKSEFLQKLRGTLSDAEARRLIFEKFKKK